MSCVGVSGHVFVPLAYHLLTKTDVLTSIYIIRGLILVRFSHLQKSYNLHSYLHLMFDTLLCSSRLICEAVQESQVISAYVVCTVFIALGTVLNVGVLSFSETLVIFFNRPYCITSLVTLFSSQKPFSIKEYEFE